LNMPRSRSRPGLPATRAAARDPRREHHDMSSMTLASGMNAQGAHTSERNGGAGPEFDR
jgi:hypothetical protein